MHDDSYEKIAQAMRDAKDHPELRAAIDRAIALGNAGGMTKAHGLAIRDLIWERIVALDAAAIYRHVLEHGVPDAARKRGFESPN